MAVHLLPNKKEQEEVGCAAVGAATSSSDLSKSQRPLRSGARAVTPQPRPAYLQLKTKKDVEDALSAPVAQQPSPADEASKDDDVSGVVDHYVVRPMQSHETPDKVRANLDAALSSLAELLRDCPTLPADLHDLSRHLPESKSLDCALKLPNSHCAFRGCAWTGSTTDELVRQLRKQHKLALQQRMDALRHKVGTKAAEEETLIASAYNESIAIAIRKGAPLASYSIDRRCMTDYVRDIAKDDTCALICLVCARRFPYVSQRRNMKIKKMRLLERVDQCGAESALFVVDRHCKQRTC